MKKKDMAELVKKSVQTDQGLANRFERAQNLLEREPTGFPLAAGGERESSTKSTRLVGEGIVSVPVDKVDMNPFNARRIYRQDRISELAVSISSSGQLVPGMATVRGDRYMLVAGHYRWKAIKLAGLPTMDLIIKEGLTDKDLFEFSYKENTDRNEQSALDNALAWRDLLNQKVYANETELAEAVGLSLPNVNKTLQILKLSPEVVDVISRQSRPVAMSALYELVLLESAADQSVALKMAELLTQGEIGRREVNEARMRYETPKQRKPKETSRQHKIRRGDQEVGTLKEWDSGRVTLDLRVENNEERIALVEELKRLTNIKSGF